MSNFTFKDGLKLGFGIIVAQLIAGAVIAVLGLVMVAIIGLFI